LFFIAGKTSRKKGLLLLSDRQKYEAVSYFCGSGATFAFCGFTGKSESFFCEVQGNCDSFICPL
jgi:hypothetical protein